MKFVIGVAYLFVCTFLSVFELGSKPAHAISENVVIYQVQTGGAGTGTATQEIIILYNPGTDINISNWCIGYSSASDNAGFKPCITPPAQTELWLASGNMLSMATQEFVDANPGFTPDFLISGGMAATGGHLRIFDALNNEVDKVGWGGAVSPEGLAVSAHSSGLVLSRNLTNLQPDTDVNAVDFSSQLIVSPIVSGLFEVEVDVDICSNLEGVQADIPSGYVVTEDGECFEDVCPNIDELQQSVPDGYQINEEGACQQIVLESRVLFITEILPNPPSYDTDLEFIEVYNPNGEAIELNGYRIEVGPSFTKSFTFSDGVIQADSYMLIYDSVSGITLPNSSGVSLRIIAPTGNMVSESNVYSNADDDVSWALLDDQWIYTNQITPGAANKPYLESSVNEVEGTTTVYAPCPVGKYRNPETNRCRNIETAVSQLVPCDEDEYRNPETNRCRKASSATSLGPCPEGQERNPETNRCRQVSVLAGSDETELTTVTDVAVESTEGAVNWTVIVLTLLGTLGYMFYEWRSELSQYFYKFGLRN